MSQEGLNQRLVGLACLSPAFLISPFFGVKCFSMPRHYFAYISMSCSCFSTVDVILSFSTTR